MMLRCSSMPADTELVAGLFEELVVAGAIERHDFEGVLLAVGLAPYVQNGAVRPCQRAKYLKRPNLSPTFTGRGFLVSCDTMIRRHRRGNIAGKEPRAK